MKHRTGKHKKRFFKKLRIDLFEKINKTDKSLAGLTKKRGLDYIKSQMKEETLQLTLWNSKEHDSLLCTSAGQNTGQSRRHGYIPRDIKLPQD